MTSSSSTKEEYKLYSFPGQNTGEPIRMLMNYAGQPFQEVKVPLEEWQEKWKDEMPHGKLPVLETSNGQRLSESHAILRHLANKFGLAGKTDLDRLKSDEIVDLHKDFSNEIKPYMNTAAGPTVHESGGNNKSQLLDSVLLPAATRYFGQLQQILEKNMAEMPFCKKLQSGGPFLTGFMPTFADFLVGDSLRSLKGTHSAILDKFPVLSQFMGRMFELPKLKEYVQKKAQ